MAALRDLELYLIRHAIAAERGPDWPDDAARPLTPAGAAKFRKAVAGLAAFGLEVDIIFTSPFVRCRQTADLLASGLPGSPRVQPIDALAPGGGHTAVIEEIARLARRPRIALVGHDPDIGHLAGRLLGLRRGLEFRKGAVCRIDVDGLPPGSPGQLRWFAPPRMLRRLG
ncbi:MAG TPA: histidine phosphatase family protein [Vicinamibacterales bacterium]